MYAFIEGQVCEKGNGFLVILAAGVGWQLNCSNNTLQAAPALGEKMRCHSVSGVGSKTALGLLGAMPLRDLNLAILLGDVAALSRAPGIGKKTAQRIALELKEKVTQADVSARTDSTAPSGSAAVPADHVIEAIEALTALGYSSLEARNAVSAVKDQSDRAEELIRLALRSMAGM